MKKTILLAAISCLGFASMQSQTFFQKTFPAVSIDPAFCPLVNTGGLLVATGTEFDTTSKISLYSLDPSGQPLASHTLQIPGLPIAATALERSGNQYFLGYESMNTAISDRGGFMILDAQMNIVVAKEISTQMGGSFIKDIAPLSDGGVLMLAGDSEQQIWLRLDATGNTQWVKKVQSDYFIEWEQIRPLPSGDFIATGNAGAQLVNSQIVLAQGTSNGTLSWIKFYDTNFHHHRVRCEALSDGHIGIAASMIDPSFSNQFANVLNLDAQGNVVWAKSFSAPYPNPLFSTMPLPNGGFAWAGKEFSPIAYHTYMAGADANGNLLWSTAQASTDDPTPRKMFATNGGDIYLGGGTEDGLTHAFAMRTSPQGLTCNDIPETFTWTNANYSTSTRATTVTAGLSFSTISATISAQNLQSDFQCQLVSAPDPSSTHAFTVFPNPLHETGYFKLPEAGRRMPEFTVTGMDGRTFALPLQRMGDTFQFSTSALQPGQYHFQVRQGGSHLGSGRFVVLE